MGLRFDPIGGGQFKQAVKQIIEAERQPIKALEARKTREDAKLKLFQEFKGKFSGVDKALSELTDFRKFRELKVDLGDGASQVSVTVDKNTAETGTYQLEVSELARKTSILSNGFEKPDDPTLGIGFVVMYLNNGEKVDVFINEENASLRGIESAINRQVNCPVQASVIKDVSDTDKPWKLMLSAKKDGIAESVEFPEFYFLDGAQDFYIDGDNSAQNAFLKLDGFEIETESNDIENFLKGVNLHLKQAKPDVPFTMRITEDFQKIAGKVKLLVDQINGILEFINKQNQIDEKSDTRTTFAGDTSLNNVEYRIRNLLHEGIAVSDPSKDEGYRVIFMNQLGVEFEKNGLLSFKEDRFTKFMEGNFRVTAEAITGEDGFANRLQQIFRGYTRGNDGLLALREAGLKTRVRQIDEQIADKERRLEQRQQALVDQFSRLQATIGNMQRQQQYLQATLPSGGGGNLISQLLGG